ncbi:MAG: pur operon repressor, partial [Lactobacillus crispatus]|nr:pur operon repressor [Lactobacillus crispatus]
TIAGVCVLCEADFDKEKLIKNYLSLVKISEIDTAQKLIVAEPGNFLTETDFDRF